MNWLVWKNGKRVGPLSEQDLAALIQSGEVGASHPVCREGSTTWTPVCRLPELARWLPGGSLESPEVRESETLDLPTPERPELRLPETPTAPTGEPAAGPSDSRTPGLSDSRIPRPSSSSYIRNHWRGELPLAVSYWVNGTLLSVLVATVGLLLAQVVDFPSAPRFWSGAMIAFWVLAFVAIAWQVVGVWRSAARHVGRGGARRWAIAARVAIVMGLVQAMVLMATQAGPQIVELAAMLAGRDPIHGYEIRLLRGNSEIEVSGYIAFGLTDHVAVALAANPGVTVVHLNSGGGRVAEARKLRDLIASRRLSTYTSRQCLSACVIPFLAGERRMIAPGAKIGFHQYTFAGKATMQTLADMEKEKTYFASRGVSASFIAHAFEPTSTLWYPTVEQMLAAGFVTGYADTGEVALSGMSMNEIDGLDQTLREDPLYAAVEQFEPEAYQEIMKAVKDGFRRGQTMADLRARTLPTIQRVYRKRLPFASDDAMAAFAQLMVDEIGVLRSDPDRCAAYLFSPGDPGTDMRVLLGRDLVQRELAVMAEVIRSASSGAWRPPDETELMPLRAEMVGRLTETWSAEDLAVLASLGRSGGDPERTCEVCYRYYQEMANLPAHKAGPMLRHTFATGRR